MATGSPPDWNFFLQTLRDLDYESLSNPLSSVLPPGGGATEFRAAALAAGFPDSTAVRSLNRQCSSGLQACVDIANAISAGMIEVGVGAGMESMSLQYGRPGAVTEFSENMAKDRGISRAKQDAFAAASYHKAAHAHQAGWFDAESAPLTVKYEDSKTDTWSEITVSKDDGIRKGVTAESLGKIKPAFAKDGSIHGGNASVLLMKRSTAERLGQTILSKYVTASVVGVAPLLMGVGPWAAIPIALEKAGISKDGVDVYEINEAFAS
ncbi:hypothetical protein VE03_05522 [Pseudogymnoascus sp. 23342-1-I1]|nr:hypothetical protein VE03_05522 [Pseudogymnoascus sp. 23342-1-I1]